jgi:hypothetical protein
VTRLLPLLLVGCSTLPKESELTGFWSSLEMGTVRAFEFGPDLDDEELTGVELGYRLYVYEGGRNERVVQTGTFETVSSADVNGESLKDALVLQVLWDQEPSIIGSQIGYEVVDFTGSQLFLSVSTAPDGVRSYLAVEELP